MLQGLLDGEALCRIQCEDPVEHVPQLHHFLRLGLWYLWFP
jgi:hypothetical protein